MKHDEFTRHHEDLFTTFRDSRFFFALTNETIQPSQIARYLVQDAYYLEALRVRLSELAEMVDDPLAQATLREHGNAASSLPAVARRLVVEELKLPELLSEPHDKTTQAYIDHQRQCVCRDVREGLVSLLPCYLFYPFFASRIRSKAPELPMLNKCLSFVSTEQEADRWVEEILSVCDRCGLQKVAPSEEVAFASSAKFEAAMLEMAMMS